MAQSKQHQYDDDSQLAYFAQQDAETGRVRKVQYVNGVEQPLLNEGGASDEAHAIGYAAADAVCCVHRCHEHCVAPCLLACACELPWIHTLCRAACVH